MDNYADKSCWGITIWAIAVFAGAILLATMFSQGDAGTMIAATISK